MEITETPTLISRLYTQKVRFDSNHIRQSLMRICHFFARRIDKLLSNTVTLCLNDALHNVSAADYLLSFLKPLLSL